jgi:ankyrin repeat protein
VEAGNSELDEDNIPQIEDMVSVCAGLVTFDKESGIIRLVHYTAQEYLERTQKNWFLNAERDIAKFKSGLRQSSEKPKDLLRSNQLYSYAAHNLFPHAEAIIASTCLTYLLFDDFKQGPCESEGFIECRVKNYPFLSYAASYWGLHARMSESDPNVRDIIFEFFKSRGAMATAHQINRFARGYREEYYTFDESLSVGPLHFASYFGLQEALNELLDLGIYHVNRPTKMGSTPLIHAAAMGHVSTVRMLLQRGADPYLKNWYGNALACAAEAGKSDVISELVHHGMSPNGTRDDDRIPINCAMDNDHASALETLVLLGADISTADVYGLPFFHRAAYEGCDKIVELMLQRRLADVESKSSYARTALSYAAEVGHEATVKQLLNRGADTESRDNYGRTPLSWAVTGGHDVIVKLLLKIGAEAKSKDNRGWTPLSWASVQGHDAVVQLLLENGADIETEERMAKRHCHWPLRTSMRQSSGCCSRRAPVSR